MPALRSTTDLRFSVGKSGIDETQQSLALGKSRCRQTIEVFAAETNVGEKFVITMFVEMQEGAAAAIERAAGLFL